MVCPVGAVGARLALGVDATHLESGRRVVDEPRDVSRGIGGAQADGMTAARQLDRDGGGDRGFAHASLAHGHDDALARALELIDELLQGRGQLAALRRRRLRIGSSLGVEHVPQGLHAEQGTLAELTPNEYAAAKEYHDSHHICLVAHAGTRAKPRVYRFQYNPQRKLWLDKKQRYYLDIEEVTAARVSMKDAAEESGLSLRKMTTPPRVGQQLTTA